MKTKIILLIILWFTFLAARTCVAAESSVFTDLKNDLRSNLNGMTSQYVLAAGITLGTANAILKLNKKKMIYCQPPDLALSLRDYQRITIKGYNKERSHFDAIEINNPLEALSMATTLGMVLEYPCY